MAERVLFVDYENVQALNVATIPADTAVHVVLGAKQKSIVAKVQEKLKPLGERATINRIKTIAPNAVDFCIAYYLGEELVRRPTASCIVLSKDKRGFDPLVLHLTKERGFKVRRVNSQREAFAAPKALKTKKASVAAAKTESCPHYDRLLTLLRKELVRPLKRKGLVGKLKSWFPTLDPGQRASLLDRLYADGHVREASGSVAYQL